MARIKKYGDTQVQNLTSFNTFITDVNPNSEYFRITEFKESFSGGKNGFLIEGSENLLKLKLKYWMWMVTPFIGNLEMVYLNIMKVYLKL
jgi:hypothetical protein